MIMVSTSVCISTEVPSEEISMLSKGLRERRRSARSEEIECRDLNMLSVRGASSSLLCASGLEER